MGAALKTKFYDIPKAQQKKMTRMFDVAVKSYDPGAPMTIDGMGNTSIPDRGNELMPKECWDLRNYMLNPIVLFNHNYDKAIGVCTVIEARDEGLYFQATIGDPAAGHEMTDDQTKARSLLAQKILRSLSVGFIAKQYKIDEKTGLLTYTDVELLEISVVSIPMQQNSQLTNVKHAKGTAMDAVDEKEDKKPSENEVGFDKEALNGIKSVMDETHTVCKSIHDMCSKMTGAGDDKKALDDANAKIADLEKQVAELTDTVKKREDYAAKCHEKIESLKQIVERKI